MADQVNPLGSLATGLPSALLAVGTNRSESARARPTNLPQRQPESTQGPAAAKAGESPEAAAAKLNAHLAGANTELRFKVDKASGRTVFQVIKEGTGEVLLQVPSDELLSMARKLREFAEQAGAAGVLLDKQS